MSLVGSVLNKNHSSVKDFMSMCTVDDWFVCIAWINSSYNISGDMTKQVY